MHRIKIKVPKVPPKKLSVNSSRFFLSVRNIGIFLRTFFCFIKNLLFNGEIPWKVKVLHGIPIYQSRTFILRSVVEHGTSNTNAAFPLHGIRLGTL